MDSKVISVIALCLATVALGLSIAALVAANKENTVESFMKQVQKEGERARRTFEAADKAISGGK